MNSIASSREFLFTQKDFERVRSLVKNGAGIALSDKKFDMVYSRISRRIRQCRLTNANEYLNFVESDRQEYVQFINALTTNLTYFFREKHHFDFVENTVVNEWRARSPAPNQLRLWSAGCSTGEEAYSLAMTVKPFVNSYPMCDLKILATDIDTSVLVKGKEAVYDVEQLKGVSPSQRIHYFKKAGEHLHLLQVKDDIKSMVFFKTLNLMDHWPMSRSFDLIFCRNVLIYFDRPTQQQLLQRFADRLKIGGYLILGHSESLGDVAKQFDFLGKTIYRKKS